MVSNKKGSSKRLTKDSDGNKELSESEMSFGVEEEKEHDSMDSPKSENSFVAFDEQVEEEDEFEDAEEGTLMLSDQE